MENHLIRLSKANNLIVKKHTLYKWSSNGTHPDLFRRLGGMLFVDLRVLCKLMGIENESEYIKEVQGE